MIYYSLDVMMNHCSHQKQFLDRLETNLVHKDVRGTYLIVDAKRSAVVLSGIADVEVKKVWERLAVESMLKEYSNRSNKFSASYPNVDTLSPNDPTSMLVKGKFQDLSMRQGIFINMDHIENFVELFPWSHVEEVELNILNNKVGSKNNLSHKKFRHLLELISLSYTLAMDPARNICGVMPCQWQLQM